MHKAIPKPLHKATQHGLFGAILVSVTWLAALAFLAVAQFPPAGVGGPIEGLVVDDVGPVGGCTVRVKGTAQSTRTNRRGRFVLRGVALQSPRIVAAKEGYYIAGADFDPGAPLRIQLHKHDIVDHPDYEWVAPAPAVANPKQCGNCHREIYREWSQSAHARSANNARFHNVYDGTDADGNENIGWNLLADYPHGAGVCAACHFPSLEPRLGDLADLTTVEGVHTQGTHCDFCHKVADVSVQQVGLNHGRFAMRLVRPRGDEQIFFGPLDDVDRGEDVHSPLYKQSEYCASCHEGTLFGTRAYTTYTEWLNSPQAGAGIQCQDCHMAPTGRMTNVAPAHGGIERDPGTLASHSLVGGDRAYLASHLSLAIRVTGSDGEHLVDVTVRPHGIGHRAPTGHPSRALILWLEARNEDGELLSLASGPKLPELAGQGSPKTGGLSGRPGKMFAKVLEGFDGKQGVPYWQPTRLAYDTRLHPETADLSRFVFRQTVGETRGDIHITAKLIYRRFSKQVADEKRWPDNDILVVEEQATIRQRGPAE